MSPVHIISFGAGVQSSCMALMAAAGDLLPMPVAAIFADTQAEPESVYAWLDWITPRLPFPVYRVTAGDLGARALEMKRTADGRLFSKADIPVYTRSVEGDLGKVPQRSCTRDFKIAPILQMARKVGSIARGQKTVGVVQWIGISLDEVSRMKPSREPWSLSRWPLIEARMSRHDCILWMERHGFPRPPRSACVFCPFHNNHEWRRLRDDEPWEFERAIQFERDLQAAKTASNNFRSTPFLHRSCVPLAELDLSTAEERGQINLFENECEGMCGV